MSRAKASSISRILVAGYGSIGKRHLRIARGLFEDADIRILRHERSDDTPEHANGCFFRLEDAVAFAPDIAVIANPASHHTQVAAPLAEAGTHLLIEKPLACSSEDAVAFLDACRETDVCLLIGYNLRFVDSLRKFRELINEGAVGRVLSVRCEVGQFLPGWRKGKDYRDSVSGSRAKGGGVLLELSHEIDYLKWIFGGIERVNAALSRQSRLEIDVEDTAHMVLEFKKTNDDPPLRVSLNMDFIRHDTTRSCIAIGERTSLKWDGVRGTVERWNDGENDWEKVFGERPVRDRSLEREWRHLVDCIKGRDTPLVGGDDALATLHVIDAARLSSINESWIGVNTCRSCTETGS